MNIIRDENHYLMNPDLSLKAKGLLSVILSLPENRDFTIKELVAICKEGRECVSSAILELEKAGYIIRNRTRRWEVAAVEYGTDGF